MRKITTPKDMAPDLAELDQAVSDFEKQFTEERKGDKTVSFSYRLLIE